MQSPSSDAKFRSMYEEHWDAIHMYCLRRLATEDGNEATADVFLIAWRRLEQVPPGGDARKWLYGVARNVVRNHQRSSRRRHRLLARRASLGEQPPEQPDTIVVRRSEDAEVIAALQRLSESDQELLRLKVWEEASHAEIGEIMGLSDRAVEGRIARALGRLARKLSSTAVPAVPAHPRTASEGGEW